jgi:cysteinyl-tRNA synthetase
MIAAANDALDANPKDKTLKKTLLANIAFIDTLLGFGGKDPYSYFQIGIDEEQKARIEALIAQRSEAKKNKDFAKADAIRDELYAMGITIMDTPEGTVWEKN